MLRTIRAWAAVALVSAAAAVALLPPPASADVIGTLTFAPPTGTDVLAPEARTSAGCPDTADGYIAFLTGPVFAEPFVIVDNQSVNFSTTGPFDVQFKMSFKDAADDRKVTITPGDYLITLHCIDTFLVDVKASFTGTVTFVSATEYGSGGANPSTSASATPSASTSTSASPSPSATVSTSATPDPTPTSTEDPDPTPTATETPSPTPTTTVAATLPITGPPSADRLLLVGLLLVAAGVVLVAAGRRPAGAPRS
ncbi:hypothetical protein AB0M02_33635 [Actinoplanes sp. NPDC051861]|uniref:hypothetical protein n=1 Tax=Actinoplanes sp. NPDC051861 TaxID=3155170 RepID=UPI00341B94BE